MRSTSFDLLALVVAYSFLFGWLLLSSNLLPYVFDNNESFSAFVHGSNLYHFGLSGSFGLTDEAYGPDPAAHPYVYTHQGNFPRLFTFALYALGLSTVESQIVFSTFTVGLGSILLAWVFFYRLLGRATANFTVFLLMTEYILMAQWLVNTFKVWHGFLLFAMLTVIQSYVSDRRQRWLWLLTLISACVGYFDLLMGVFTFTTSAVYVVWSLRGHGLTAIRAPFTAMIAGGLVSIAILLTQLIAYYGVTGLKQDFMLTFVGRNYADPQFGSRLQEFFIEHRIVFWESLVDSKPFANVAGMLKSIFQYGFGILTPYFSFLIWAILLPPIFCALSRTTPDSQPAGRDLARDVGTIAAALTIFVVSKFALGYVGAWIGAIFALTWIMTLFGATRGRLNALKGFLGRKQGLRAIRGMRGLTFFLFLASANLVAMAICFTDLVEGRTESTWAVFRAVGGGLIAFIVPAAILSIGIMCLWRGTRRSTPDPHRLMAAASSLLALAVLALGHEMLYRYTGDPMGIIWAYTLIPWTASGSTKLFALVAVVLSVWVWFFDERHATVTHSLLVRLAPFAVAISIGYAAAYAFAPGYMVLINLRRYTPVLVFLVVPAAAVMFAVVWGWMKAHHDQQRVITWLVPAAATLLLIHASVFWIGRQWTYFSLLPPDGANPYARLDRSPYQGASFVVNGYGAPVAAKTGSWAYIDNLFIATGAYRLDAHGYRPDGSDVYKWLANRDAPKYRAPDYAICTSITGFESAAFVVQLMRRNPERLMHPSDAFKPRIEVPGVPPLIVPPFGCVSAFLQGEKLQNNESNKPRLTLVDRDLSPLNRWSIVKLESDFPPFLSPLPGQKEYRINLALNRTTTGRCVAEIHYAYQQQQGKPEAGSILRAWLEHPTKDEIRKGRELYYGTAKASLALPPIVNGKLMVSLTPKTLTRVGETYTSEQVQVSDCR